MRWKNWSVAETCDASDLPRHARCFSLLNKGAKGHAFLPRTRVKIRQWRWLSGVQNPGCSSSHGPVLSLGICRWHGGNLGDYDVYPAHREAGGESSRQPGGSLRSPTWWGWRPALDGVRVLRGPQLTCPVGGQWVPQELMQFVMMLCWALGWAALYSQGRPKPSLEGARPYLGDGHKATSRTENMVPFSEKNILSVPFQALHPVTPFGEEWGLGNEIPDVLINGFFFISPT